MKCGAAIHQSGSTTKTWLTIVYTPGRLSTSNLMAVERGVFWASWLVCVSISPYLLLWHFLVRRCDLKPLNSWTDPMLKSWKKYDGAMPPIWYYCKLLSVVRKLFGVEFYGSRCRDIMTLVWAYRFMCVRGLCPLKFVVATVTAFSALCDAFYHVRDYFVCETALIFWSTTSLERFHPTGSLRFGW